MYCIVNNDDRCARCSRNTMKNAFFVVFCVLLFLLACGVFLFLLACGVYCVYCV